MTRAPYFSVEDCAIIMHGYEEFKSTLTTKSNTAAANKARETCWQHIAARLNASSRTGVKRTWKQIRMKYKNIIQSANRKKTDQRKIKGNSPHPESTETERLALSQNPSKPVMEGLQEGLSPVPAADDYQNTVSVQDDRGRMALPKLPAHALAEPLIQADNHVEETFPVVSDTPAAEGDTNSTRASVDCTSQHPPTELAGADTVRALNKRMLELDCEKKTLEIKKLKLEIEQLEHEKKLKTSSSSCLAPVGKDTSVAPRGIWLQEGPEVTCPLIAPRPLPSPKTSFQHADQLHHRLVQQLYRYGPQTTTERGEDCGEDHQDSAALLPGQLPPQSTEESCLHAQRPHTPPTRTVYTSALRTEDRSVKSRTP